MLSIGFVPVDGDVVVLGGARHLVLRTERAHEFTIGQALHGIPRHVCPTVSMHGEAVVIDRGKVVETWSITARNRRITV
jgi:D-serine deaminase-like pyridoxal phosphate-dependent protein